MKYWHRAKPVLKPLFLWLLGLAYLIGLFAGVTSVLSQLPTPLPLDSLDFSESRAMQTMQGLVSIGGRPIDSYANRNDTLAFIRNKLSAIQANATVMGHTRLEFDLQNETGESETCVFNMFNILFIIGFNGFLFLVLFGS
jgi:hypothetical protein